MSQRRRTPRGTPGNWGSAPHPQNTEGLPDGCRPPAELAVPSGTRQRSRSASLPRRCALGCRRGPLVSGPGQRPRCESCRCAGTPRGSWRQTTPKTHSYTREARRRHVMGGQSVPRVSTLCAAQKSQQPPTKRNRWERQHSGWAGPALTPPAQKPKSSVPT